MMKTLSLNVCPECVHDCTHLGVVGVGFFLIIFDSVEQRMLVSMQ